MGKKYHLLWHIIIMLPNSDIFCLQWEITHYENSKYHIKSSLNSRVLAIRTSTRDPNVIVAVGESNNYVTHWTIKPRHDSYL